MKSEKSHLVTLSPCSAPAQTIIPAGASDSTPAQTASQSGDGVVKDQNIAVNKETAAKDKDSAGKDKEKDKEKEQTASSGDKKNAKHKKNYCN